MELSEEQLKVKNEVLTRENAILRDEILNLKILFGVIKFEEGGDTVEPSADESHGYSEDS